MHARLSTARVVARMSRRVNLEGTPTRSSHEIDARHTLHATKESLAEKGTSTTCSIA